MNQRAYALIGGVQFSHQQRARYCHHQRLALLAININTWYCQSTSTRGVCHQQEFVVLPINNDTRCWPSTTAPGISHQQRYAVFGHQNDTWNSLSTS